MEPHSYLAQQRGSMALSRVGTDNPMSVARATSWFNAMARLGIYLPLFVVHDMGCLFTMQEGFGGYHFRDQEPVVPLSPPVRKLVAGYERVLRRLAESEVIKRLTVLRVGDEVTAVLLTRVLADCFQDWEHPGKRAGVSELPTEFRTLEDGEIRESFAAYDPKSYWSFLRTLNAKELHIYTCTELIDLDTVKLLGVFKEDSASGSEALGGALQLVDLLGSLQSPEAADVANFSLDLLPSVLETKRASGTQSFSVDGYASLERKGQIDSLMLSELAYDDEIFEQKVVDQELFYFGHEREHENERRLHYLLVDSSASMRGKRQVFARALALTLVKKLSLQGDEVWLRFFDSRLHETVKVQKGKAFPVPYLLSFRSEHGRNYGRVFRQLLLDVSRLKREQHRNVIIYLITHGQCHVAPDLIAGLAQHAHLYGIVILPSSDVELDFLPLMHRHQIVDADSLSTREGRRDRALNIVEDVSPLSEEPAVDDEDELLELEHG